MTEAIQTDAGMDVLTNKDIRHFFFQNNRSLTNMYPVGVT